MKQYTIAELTEIVNRALDDINYPKVPQGLYEPIAYVLSMGGKRLRPVLMLLAYNLYKEDVTRIFSHV
mgnify:CR=1 FL=1